MNTPKIALIAAIGKNRELGRDNKLLWDIPEDLKRFKELTNGHPIIMGRKTFDSIGRVLPNRTNIVITRDVTGFLRKAKDAGYAEQNFVASSSLTNAIDVAKAEKIPGNDEIFIIGGAQIFEQAIGLADRLYITLIDAVFEADTFFPQYTGFSKIVQKEHNASVGYTYSFLVLEK